MTARFPVPVIKPTLEAIDFHRFQGEYARILARKIPTAGTVTFHADKQQLLDHLPDAARERASALFAEPVAAQPPIKVGRDALLFPFVTARDQIVAGLVPSLDPLVVKRAASDWLVEVQRSAFREFLDIAHARTDAETGLCNLVHLYSLLSATPAPETTVQLVLVELPPRNRSPRDAFQHARKGAYALQRLVERGLLHHLGQCLFAVYLQNSSEQSAEHIGSKLVDVLKKEGFYSVHVGSGSMPSEDAGMGADGDSRYRLLSEAWAALQMAEKRGPFAFCDYSILSRPERHPLCPAETAVLRKVRKKYRDSEMFCLVEFRGGTCSGGELANRLREAVAPDLLVPAGDSVLLFLDGQDAEQARVLTVSLLSALNRGVAPAERVSAGIGHYPYAGFHKSEVPANSRKALLHAGFFEPGAAVVFDAVSLNISGDVYFGDGDLHKALKEYRRGLVCEADNVNLLNSLGVTYAMLDRHAPARERFREVLAVEPDNFMALYNLGLGEVRRGDSASALSYFEQALAAYREEDGAEARSDLQLQLAKLYCRQAMFAKAHALLSEWHDASAGSPQAGMALRYLGEACHGLGRRPEAKIWLQKALRFNELDPEAMSLLGLVYLEDGEGAEIALTLCEKGVELSEANAAVRLRLAKVQMACNLLPEARKNLAKCLGDKRIEREVRSCLGEVWQRLGKRKQAERWLATISR